MGLGPWDLGIIGHGTTVLWDYSILDPGALGARGPWTRDPGPGDQETREPLEPRDQGT